MLQYKIKKINQDFDLNVNNQNEAWNISQEISLKYNWPKFPYQPKVRVKSLYSEKFLYLRFDVEEDAIQSTATKINDFVYIDSCIEFFCAPDPKRPDLYYNLEMNCCGNVYMAYGPDRRLGERIFVPVQALEKIIYSTSIKGATKEISPSDKKWEIEIKIPWSVYQTMSQTPVPLKGSVWRGNFYKCGDKLPKIHYGSWNKIEVPSPDFHRPEFFGELIFD